MLKKVLFFKKSIYWSEILPFIIFRWLMVDGCDADYLHHCVTGRYV